VGGQVDPNSIPHRKIDDPLAECVDQTGTVLVRSDLREWRRCTIARAAPRLPVGGVDTGDENADPHLARPRLSHIAIDQPKNRRVTGSGVDNRLHAYETSILSPSFQAPIMILAARGHRRTMSSFIQRC
jgi:hypothetical protein